MSLEPGQILDGKYRIVRLIGEGGMGAVFEGENTRIQRRVAIKVVHAAYAADTAVMARFQREAQAAGRIGNDHILEVLDLGALPDGSQYMVLEFLDGEPLASRIERRGRLTPQELGPLVVQMLKGLGAAHGAGIFHRDLKPDNIFILREKAGRADFVKIIDFGISKFQPLSGDAAMNMTSTGAVMGTPFYMSPEQASGSRAVDARSDLYSMGVILYECVTGHVPFDGNTFNELMFKIVLSDAPSPLDVVPDLDPAFVSIITKAMVKDVALRFQTAEEFSKAVTAWMESGTAVASVPLDASEHAARGAARNAFASASGEIPLPDPAARKTGGGVPRGRATGGSWATSQFGATPPNHKVLVGAIAGGLLLAASVVAAVVMTRGGSPTPASIDSAAAAKAVAAPPPLASSPAAPVTTQAPPGPAKDAPLAVTPVPPSPSAAPEKDSSSRDHTVAAKRTVTKPVSSAGKAPPPGKTPPKSAGGEPYFGY